MLIATVQKSRDPDRRYPFFFIRYLRPPDNFNMSLAPEDYVRLLSSAFDLHPRTHPQGGGRDCVIFGAVALLGWRDARPRGRDLSAR